MAYYTATAYVDVSGTVYPGMQVSVTVPQEEAVDRLCDEMKMRQTDRLRHGQGNMVQNYVFNDLITNLERISDHCSNIALAALH